MEQFGTHKYCKKCGSDSADIEYIPPSFFEKINGDREVTEQEYMKITCRVCGYSFKERPLDYKEENK